MRGNHTLSQEIVKFIDYASEEFVKQIMERKTSLKVMGHMPYIGVISYPGGDFKVGTLYSPSVQFQNSVYVGYMTMHFPEYESSDNSKLSYSLLEFELDGMIRQFLQVSQPDTVSQNGTKFRDFLAQKFPKAGNLIPFNRHAMHTLTAISVSGGIYLDSPTGFIPTTSGDGSFTSSLEFEFAVSGYRLIMQ